MLTPSDSHPRSFLLSPSSRTCCSKHHWSPWKDIINNFLHLSSVFADIQLTSRTFVQTIPRYSINLSLFSLQTSKPTSITSEIGPNNQGSSTSSPYRRHASLHAFLHKASLVRFPDRSSVDDTGASFLTYAAIGSLYWSAECWTPCAFSSGSGGVSLRLNVDGSGASSTTPGASSSPSLRVVMTCGGGPRSAEALALVIDIAGST